MLSSTNKGYLVQWCHGGHSVFSQFVVRRHSEGGACSHTVTMAHSSKPLALIRATVCVGLWAITILKTICPSALVFSAGNGRLPDTVSTCINVLDKPFIPVSFPIVKKVLPNICLFCSAKNLSIFPISFYLIELANLDYVTLPLNPCVHSPLYIHFPLLSTPRPWRFPFCQWPS